LKSLEQQPALEQAVVAGKGSDINRFLVRVQSHGGIVSGITIIHTAQWA